MWPFKRAEEPAPEPTADPTILVVPAPPPAYDRVVMRQMGLRAGQWVKDPQGRVGILVGLNEFGVADVMLTLPDGTNFMLITIEASALKSAYWDDIPTPRQPPLERGLELGYTTRGGS